MVIGISKMNIYNKFKLNSWIAIWLWPMNTLKYLLNSMEYNKNIRTVFLYMVPMQIVSAILFVFNLLPDKKMILFLRDPSEYLYGFLVTPIFGCLYLYLGSWVLCTIEKYFNRNVQKRQIQIIILWSGIIPLTFIEFIQSIMIWFIPRSNQFGDLIAIVFVVWFLSIFLCGIIELSNIIITLNVTLYIITVVALIIFRLLILSMLASDYTTIQIMSL